MHIDTSLNIYALGVAACEEGYFGYNCKPCPPGFYGIECGGRCSIQCADEDCDHISGCINRTEYIVQHGGAGKRYTDTVKNVFKTYVSNYSSLVKLTFFFILLSLRVFVIESTSETSSRSNFTSSTDSSTSKSNILFITEDPMTQAVHLKYILAGGLMIFVMFIIVIVLQLFTCMKSKFTKTKTLKRKTCKEKVPFDESADDVQQTNEQTDNTTSPERNLSNFNNTLNFVYCEIDDFSPVFSNTSSEYEKPHILSEPKLSYSSLTSDNCFHFHELNEQYVEPQSRLFEESTSNLYLQPI